MTTKYFDYNATTPLHDLAKKQIIDTCDIVGNPSSTHKMGLKARMVVDNARYEVAQCFDIRPEQVIFTSSGTESNNLILKGYASVANGKGILTTKLEHPSVTNVVEGLDSINYKVNTVPLLGTSIDYDALEQLLKTGEYGLLSLSNVNSETGIIQDVKKAVEICNKYNCLVHTDAIQAWGKTELDYKDLGVSLMTLSTHKVSLAKGIGIVLTDGKVNLPALLHGGSQERGRRAGTENVLALSTLHVVEQVVKDLSNARDTIKQLRDYLEQEVKKINPKSIIVGYDTNRVDNTSFIITPGLDSQTQIIAFDMNDICVSAGSACSSGDVKESSVITALGVEPSLAKCGIRISLGYKSTKEEVDDFLKAYENITS